MFSSTTPPHDAVPERLDDLTAFHNRPRLDAIERPAVYLRDDDILRDVNEPTCQIAGVRGLQRRVRKTLPRAMR